jgi:hypothetical protein
MRLPRGEWLGLGSDRLFLEGTASLTQLTGTWMGPKCPSGRWTVQKNLSILPGIDPRFFGCSAHSRQHDYSGSIKKSTFLSKYEYGAKYQEQGAKATFQH